MRSPRFSLFSDILSPKSSLQFPKEIFGICRIKVAKVFFFGGENSFNTHRMTPKIWDVHRVPCFEIYVKLIYKSQGYTNSEK